MLLCQLDFIKEASSGALGEGEIYHSPRMQIMLAGSPQGAWNFHHELQKS